MTYTLSLLAPGSYDVLLNGVVMASLVRDRTKTPTIWTAELLENMHPRRRPTPFTEAEHEFGSLEEAQKWLGIAQPPNADAERET